MVGEGLRREVTPAGLDTQQLTPDDRITDEPVELLSVLIGVSLRLGGDPCAVVALLERAVVSESVHQDAGCGPFADWFSPSMATRSASQTRSGGTSVRR